MTSLHPPSFHRNDFSTWSSSSSSPFSSVNPLSPYQNKPRPLLLLLLLLLAVNSYGRSWGSSRADTERRHNMRVYIHVHVRVRVRGRCPRAHARAERLRARARALRKELLLLGLCSKRKMSGTSGKIISMK